MQTLTVGQALWVVWNDRRFAKPKGQVVTKIGRKWATLASGARVDLATLRLDGGTHPSPGRCYLSEAAYQAERATVDAWASLCRRISSNGRPAGLTVEAIAAAEWLLFGDAAPPTAS